MASLELIDDYFKDLLTGEQQKQVEQRILADPSFAEELAFYVSAHDALRQELDADKKARFRELYEAAKAEAPAAGTPTTGAPNNPLPRQRAIRPLYALLAAAAIIVLILGGWWLFFRPANPRQLADQYIRRNLLTLDVKMSSRRDSLQLGIAKYNNNDLTGARQLFEAVLQQDPGNEFATQYTGLVYLRLKQYDNALHYFQQLAADTALYINPALFYQSLTLMERQLPGDAEKAKAMLQEVVNLRLGSKEDAQQLLSKW